MTTTMLMIDFIKIYFCKKNQKIARHLAYKDQYCILTAHNLISAIVEIGMATICAGELHPNDNINPWGHSFSTWGHSFKTSYPLIRTRTCAYQGERNVSFSEYFFTY